MAYKRKTWMEKLEDKPNLPKIILFDPKFPCGKTLVKLGAKKGDPTVITQPGDVLEIMKKVPEGKLITIKEISMMLARKYKAKFCCTLTCGIHIMTVANAAVEARLPVPFWRTLKMNGALNDKYPGGQARHKKLLEKEGFIVANRGRDMYVKDYDKRLMRLK